LRRRVLDEVICESILDVCGLVGCVGVVGDGGQFESILVAYFEVTGDKTFLFV
jgi:hypothetical protein